MAPIATKKDQLWSTDGLGFPATYYFVAKSGGDVSVESAKIRDGGKTTKEILITDSDTDDITLIGLYRPADHASILRSLRSRLAGGKRIESTLKRLDCDADKTPIGEVETFSGCIVVGLKDPEHDSNDTAEGRFEITLRVPQ